MADLELEHIQGFITFGYGHLEYAAYLFLHFDDAAQGRGWLARITPMVTPARSEKGTQAVHVALTFAGLGQLSSHAKESRYFVPTCARISLTLRQSVSKFR